MAGGFAGGWVGSSGAVVGMGVVGSWLSGKGVGWVIVGVGAEWSRGGLWSILGRGVEWGLDCVRFVAGVGDWWGVCSVGGAVGLAGLGLLRVVGFGVVRGG